MRRITVGAAMMQHYTFDPDEVRPDSLEPRLAEAMSLVEEAASRGCDILCLPELFADPFDTDDMCKWAEPMDGPVNSWLAETAKSHNIALVGTLYLKHDGGISNTGIAYNKQGDVAGTYGKVHLPGAERAATVPGSGFPVFELEGVNVGIQICYDLNFPEGCRILAIKGADIVFWPTMWGGMPEDYTDVIMRARAMENSVYVVPAAYLLADDPGFRIPKIHGRSCVIDRAGTILAEVGRRLGVAVATLEIDSPRTDESPKATERFGQRMPHLYGELAAVDPSLNDQTA